MVVAFNVVHFKFAIQSGWSVLFMNSNPNENGNIEIDVNVANEHELIDLLIELQLLIENLLFSNMDFNPNQNDHIEIDVYNAWNTRVIKMSIKRQLLSNLTNWRIKMKIHLHRMFWLQFKSTKRKSKYFNPQTIKLICVLEQRYLTTTRQFLRQFHVMLPKWIPRTIEQILNSEKHIREDGWRNH